MAISKTREAPNNYFCSIPSPDSLRTLLSAAEPCPCAGAGTAMAPGPAIAAGAATVPGAAATGGLGAGADVGAATVGNVSLCCEGMRTAAAAG